MNKFEANLPPDETLRDVFAAAAMAGLLAKAGPTLGNGACELLAKSAYRVADAMLVARDKQEVVQ